MNKVPRWVFRYVGNKTFVFSSKKKDFLPKNDKIWPKIGIFVHFGPGPAGSFGALLVGWFVVVARGLYLARHLFTLFLQFCFLYSSVFSGDVVFSLDLPFIFSGMLCTNTWGWNPQDGSSTTWSLTTTINHITPWSTMMIVMMMAWLMMMYIYYDEVCVCVCVCHEK